MPFTTEERRAENLVWETRCAWGIIVFDCNDIFVEGIFQFVIVWALIFVSFMQKTRSRSWLFI